MTEFLFSYGTLQMESVQLSAFGRLLAGQADSLPGFRLEYLRITNPEAIKISGKEFHPQVVKGKADEFVEGMVFELTQRELAKADLYETTDYKRVSRKLNSGKQAWLYVKKDD
jgi:gamma-glutamylcyclotransferase (GGCT)/AIG2-like uncharacterized protein YtfP